MPETLQEHHVKAYARLVTMRAQQKVSRLAGTVRRDGENRGAKFSFDQYGISEAIDVTVNNGDSPENDAPHFRRWATPTDVHWGKLINRTDLIRILTDPQSGYVKMGSYALGRRMDRVIISALGGLAESGQEGGTQVALPASQKVLVNYVEEGAAADSGLTVAKVRRTAMLLNQAEVEEEDRHFVYTAQQAQDLMRDPEVTSADYSTVRVLQEGKLQDQWMGFFWHRVELLPLSPAGHRLCYAYQKDGVGLAVPEEMFLRVAERPDKSFNPYVYVRQSAGAVRIEEARVVEIECDIP